MFDYINKIEIFLKEDYVERVIRDMDPEKKGIFNGIIDMEMRFEKDDQELFLTISNMLNMYVHNGLIKAQYIKEIKNVYAMQLLVFFAAARILNFQSNFFIIDAPEKVSFPLYSGSMIIYRKKDIFLKIVNNEKRIYIGEFYIPFYEIEKFDPFYNLRYITFEHDHKIKKYEKKELRELFNEI